MSASEWVIVGNAGCKRVRAWSAAFARRGRPMPRLVEYSDLLAGAWPAAGDRAPIRFESAAENQSVYRLLLREGYEAARREGYAALAPDRIHSLTDERGLWRHPRQAHLGFERLLQNAVEHFRDHRPLNPPEDILVHYDKTETMRRLSIGGVPVPPFVDRVEGYDDVLAAFRNTGRAMIKLRHGSGGAGCIAIHWSGANVRAVTTIREQEGRIYTAKQPQTVAGETNVVRLVDLIRGEKLHAEAWLPKAIWRGYGFDFRIVTVAGRVSHAVARGSRHPFTNLNLGNLRLPWDQLGLGRSWDLIRDAAERAAQVFPRSLTLGIDVVLHANRSRVSVIEVNAFGNFLPNLLDGAGRDTYEAAVDALP